MGGIKVEPTLGNLVIVIQWSPVTVITSWPTDLACPKSSWSRYGQKLSLFYNGALFWSPMHNGLDNGKVKMDFTSVQCKNSLFGCAPPLVITSERRQNDIFVQRVSNRSLSWKLRLSRPMRRRCQRCLISLSDGGFSSGASSSSLLLAALANPFGDFDDCERSLRTWTDRSASILWSKKSGPVRVMTTTVTEMTTTGYYCTYVHGGWARNLTLLWGPSLVPTKYPKENLESRLDI